MLTWNLWYEFGPWESRQSAIRRVIEREDPDVICLQEVFCTRTSTSTYSFAERLANELGHHSVTSDGPWFPRRESTVAGEETAMGNAIISRWPIESHGQITLPGKDDDAGYRK
ncbi:MAG: endonuclease/exonuclease/phosphatase family protein, partial [Ilumatobacteraceae bacterium]